MKMLEKLFGFNPRETRVRTEILAGITTFLTMAYILAVNPNILAATGMDKGALFTTTVIASAFATLLMAFYAKLPFGLAPGMGLNAFFAYTVCLTLGYTWQFALTAVLLEGIIFILLTVTNLREKIVDALPLSLRNAIVAGIGLFIAFIGLQNAGIIVNNDLDFIGKYYFRFGLAGHYRPADYFHLAGEESSWSLADRNLADDCHRYSYGIDTSGWRVEHSSFYRTHFLPVPVGAYLYKGNGDSSVYFPVCRYV